MVLYYLMHPNPKIRYVACHFVAHVSVDMKFEFQKKYGDAVLTVLINLLKIESTPCIVCHLAAALENFLEGVKFGQIAASLDILAKFLLGHSRTGTIMMKISAFGALSSLAVASGQRFQPYLEPLLSILFEYFEGVKVRYPNYS